MRVKWLKVALTIAFSIGAMRVRAQVPGSPPPGMGYPPEFGWPNPPRPPVRALTPIQREDQSLSERTKLSVKDVRKLRVAAGISDADWTTRSVNIDAKTLGQRQILLTIYSSDALCLTAEVFVHDGKDFQQIWSLSTMPGGPALCQLANCSPPTASASKTDEVVIAIPAHRDGAQYDVCDDSILVTYRRAGATFQFEKEEKRPALEICTLSEQIFEAAAHESKEADRLALIWVFRLPAGGNSALVFVKTPDGPAVFSYDEPRGPWTEDRYGKTMVTPSECIEGSKSAPIVRAQLPLTGDEAQAILDKLPKLGQHADPNHCDASPHPGCYYTMDGPMFVVIFPDGSNATVHNPPMVAGVRGPGGSPSDWAEELHVLVGDPTPQ